MALAAYFDASGHQDDQKYLVVAGFVSSPQEWINFDRLWTGRLRKDGIQYFHANEFAHSINQFAGWRDDKKRRESLCSDLMEIIKRHVFRMFGSVVINKVLNEELPERTREEYLINAYSLAGRGCAADLRLWLLKERWRTVPELIFEDGDIGKGLLRETLLRDGFSEPVFLPKKDTVKKDGMVIKGLTPLQPADWLAYEMFLASKSKNVERWPLQQFLNTPGYDTVGIYSPADLQAIRAEMHTPRDQVLRPVPKTPEDWMWD
jgi:hypothetical protein